jgi:hypothetical protein
MEAAKLPEIMRVYRDRNSPFTYSIGLANKDFTLPLTFSSAFILSGLDTLSNVFLDRRSYDNALIISKVQFLF